MGKYIGNSVTAEAVKSMKTHFGVIPEKSGIQLFQDVLDPGFCRGDDPIEAAHSR
jgi:hypothetical protein